MDRLTMTSDKGGLAFTFDLDFRSQPSEARKILALGERLKAYEDAEEQGLLVRLPCKVGDTVYVIGGSYISQLLFQEMWEIVACIENGVWGKTVFLTREEAEEALKNG